MSDMDPRLRPARDAYRSTRYPGDLAADLQALRPASSLKRQSPRRRLRVWLTAAAAVAAALLLWAAIMGPARREAAPSHPSPTMAVSLPAALPTPAMPAGLPAFTSLPGPVSPPGLSLPRVSFTVEFQSPTPSENPS